MTVQYSIVVGAALFTLAACEHTGMWRDGMPTVTRTGEVKDIIIRDDTVSPEIVTANPGDEIRWINNRQGDARVIFLLPVEGQLSCQRGFGGLMSANWNAFKNQYTAKLGVNGSASVCFKSPSEIKYVVRANSNLSSREDNIPGAINIGGGPTDDLGRRTTQAVEQQ